MNNILSFQGRRLRNPSHKAIAGILKQTPAHYEMWLYLIKSRLVKEIMLTLINQGYYQTRGGARLVLRNNRVYLTFGGNVNTLKNVRNIEKIMDKSIYEVIMHYPTYPENIGKIEMFNQMRGKAWK